MYIGYTQSFYDSDYKYVGCLLIRFYLELLILNEICRKNNQVTTDSVLSRFYFTDATITTFYIPLILKPSHRNTNKHQCRRLICPCVCFKGGKWWFPWSGVIEWFLFVHLWMWLARGIDSLDPTEIIIASPISDPH